MDFKGRIKASLTELNAKYTAAMTDLQGTVVAVDEAIQEVSGGKVRIYLNRLADNPEGTMIGLFVVGAPFNHKDGVWIEDFCVKPTGYPIQVGDYKIDSAKFAFQSSVADKAALEKHFEVMIGQANSPLMTNVALLIRNSKNE